MSSSRSESTASEQEEEDEDSESESLPSVVAPHNSDHAAGDAQTQESTEEEPIGKPPNSMMRGSGIGAGQGYERLGEAIGVGRSLNTSDLSIPERSSIGGVHVANQLNSSGSNPNPNLSSTNQTHQTPNTNPSSSSPSHLNNPTHNIHPLVASNAVPFNHDHDPPSSNEQESQREPKKPRVRLAHACDRCRRRKIKCDTHMPCAPCQAAKETCTFDTPSRRPAKKRSTIDGAVSNTLDTVGIPSGSRPRIRSQIKAPKLEKHLSTQQVVDMDALEAIIRNVPPSIHNTLINQLDASMSSSTSPSYLSSLATNNIGQSQNQTGNQPFSFGHGMTVPGGFAFSTGNANDFGGRANIANANADTGGFDLGNSPGGSGSGFSFGNNPYLGPQAILNGGGMGHDVQGKYANGAALTTKAQGKARETSVGDLERALGAMNLSNGYLYLDEIGQTKWQGATSGFPLLDLLTGKAASEYGSADDEPSSPSKASNRLRNFHNNPPLKSSKLSSMKHTGPTRKSRPMDLRESSENVPSEADGDTEMEGVDSEGKARSTASYRTNREMFFPDRQPRKSQALNPEETWKIITNVIPPDLMDTLVRCYLSTSHLLWPFLHVPSFLADYANPQKWAEPGFACFVVAVCTLSSRHVDDPRVRAKVNDPSTAGKAYFELFKRLRDLPAADRPTLYSIQAAYLVAIYAFGLGTLSKAFALLAESVTLCLDGGLHRSVEGYEFFTPIEQEMRKRTFWSIYSWDKQSAALFGKPPLIHLRDCDVPEPLQIDDEYISEEGVEEQPAGSQSRLSAFVAVIRLHVVLEGVIDACVTPASFSASPFLSRAAATISRRATQSMSLAEAESLLEEWVAILPKHWCYDAETVESKDPIRITQAERLHCLQHLVRMIMNRHRFSGYVQIPAATSDERAAHLDFCKKAMDSALTICANHVHISQRGMMTYFGVHVIHSLAQCGRTLVAVILNCKTPEFSTLIAPATEGLRSCVGLLRRFSGRYLCGLRTADILQEFCRVCHIPIDLPSALIGDGNPSPAWLRPLQRRKSPSPAPRLDGDSPSDHTESSPAADSPSVSFLAPQHTTRDLTMLLGDALDDPSSANALLSTQDFFDLSAAASPMISGANGMTSNSNSQPRQNQDYSAFDTLGSLAPPTAPFDRFETLAPDATMMDVSTNNGLGSLGDNQWDIPFASGNDALGQMSAETILQLMQQGTFLSTWQT